MAGKSPVPIHQFSHHPAFTSRMLELFNALDTHVASLIRFTEEDFQRIIPLLKAARESINQLGGSLAREADQECFGSCTQLKTHVWESASSLMLAMHHLQFFDPTQQQLAHIRQTYREVISEFEVYASAAETRPDTQYYSVLPELIALHAAQFRQINEQYQAELGVWHRNLSQVTTQVKALPGHFNADLCRHICAKEFPPTREHVLPAVADILGPLHRLREQTCLNDAFRRTVALLQSLLLAADEATQLICVAVNPADKQASLTRIRNRYTMPAERVLHDQLLGTPETNCKTEHPESDHQDIELF